MAFHRQWLWIWFALVLGGGQLLAATTREDRAYAVAISAFQDGMWSRAETELAKFIQKYPASDRAAGAVLLQAEADYKQAKFPEAIALLSLRKAGAGELGDQYAYWIGEAQFQGGDLPAAAETFIALTRDFPQSSLRLRAVVEAAAARAQLGEWPQLGALLEPTNSVFQRAVQMDPANELVVRGSLLLAQAKFAQAEFSGAAAVLESLDTQTLRPELDWQRAYLLYQVKLAAGDTNAALAATTNLVEIARSETNDALQAEGVALRANVLELLGQKSAAMAAYSDILTLKASDERERQAILKIAELAIAQNQFSEAEQWLEKYLAQFPGSPATDVARLRLGELHLQDYIVQPAATNQLSAAQDNFDQFLRVYTNSPLAGKAYLDRGWCLWLAGLAPESFAAFKAAALATNLPPEDLAVARFKMGDALFAQKDYTNSLENYRRVVEDFDAFPAVAQTLGDRALYQMLRASLELKDLSGASNALARILRLYPASDLADSGLLLVGEGLTDARQPAAGRALFQKFEEMFPNSPLRARVELAVARTYEQEQDWPAAIRQYENWVGDFPTNALRAQADYALALANFQAGSEINAFRLFTNFVAQFPTHALAPLAQYWVADHYYRLGGTNYMEAERNYKMLYQNTNWQASPLIYQARLMAGRAAMGLPSYSDAIDHFKMLTSDTNCPADLNAQALLAYGSALMQQDSPDTNNPLANFQTAVSVFSQICQLYPTNESGVLAWNEIGDCDLQLTNYDGATNAYAQVFNSPYADISARSRAQIGFGLALEKKAALAAGSDQGRLLQQALDSYLDVFDSSLGKNLRDGEVADPFWVKKAGLSALPLVEALGVADSGKFFEHLEELFPQLKDTLEKKKAVLQSARN